MNTWQTKKTEQKEYRTAMGSTDYNIPMFGYKSAFFIGILLVTTIFLVPAVCEWIQIDFRLPLVVLGGCAGGFGVAFSQFFIERNKGLCKAFWVVYSLVGIATGLLLFLVYYAGILL